MFVVCVACVAFWLLVGCRCVNVACVFVSYVLFVVCWLLGVGCCCVFVVVRCC